MTKSDDFNIYVFCICSDINQKLGLSLNVKSNKLCSTSFIIGKANAILSFSLTAKEPQNIKSVTGYEVYFTKELLNKEIIMLSEKLELFNSELPRMFLISRDKAL